MAKRRRKQPALPWYLRPQTEAQIRARANKRVNDVLNPQLDTARRDTATRINTIQGAASAAASLLASHAGATQDAYRQATADVQGLGGGYSDAMAARIKGAQDAAAEFAKSQGGQAPANQGVDTNALHDTVYHGGVVIPGSSLASQGAAATALETQNAQIPALQGLQDVHQAAQEGEQALLELAKQRPELMDKVMEALQQGEMDKLQARLQQQASDLYAKQFGETVRSHRAGETLDLLSYQEQVRSHDLAIQQAKQEGRQPNASLSRAYGYIVDSHGRPIHDKNGNNIPVKDKSTKKDQKAKNNAQYQKAVGQADQMFQDSQPTPPEAPGLPPGPPKHKWTWGAALRYLMNRYGIKRSRARQALIAAGFKAPAQKPGYIPGTKNRGPGGAGPR